MKKLIICISILIVVFYLSFSFAVLQLNPTDWPQKVRIYFVVFSITGSFLCFLFKKINEENGK